MKIIHRGKAISVEEAVGEKLCPDVYSYDGKLKKLEKHIELQNELIAKLITCLFGEESQRLTKAEQLDYILGDGFDVGY